VDWKLELVLVPVSDVDRAKAFYAEKAGFDLDLDRRVGDEFRVVQLTPPGSACSISVGTGITNAAPAPSGACTWSYPTSTPRAPSSSNAGWTLARSSTLSRAGGCRARTRSAATTARSPTSATRTATAGSCRRSGEPGR
jgi:hypothetical protein